MAARPARGRHNKMAAVLAEDEESLLPSGRDSGGLSCGLEKKARWQVRHRAPLHHCGVRTRVATLMTLAGFGITFMALWML